MKAKRIISLLLTFMLAIQYCILANDTEEIKFNDEYSLMCGLGYFDVQTMPYDEEVSGAKYAQIMYEATGYDISNYYPGVNAITALKYADALKVLLDMMGYKTLVDKNEGYPLGYVNYALQNKMTSGISFEAGERITYGKLARVIYNSFDVEIINYEFSGNGISEIYTDKEVTFLSEILKLKEIKGQVTADEADGINGNVGKGMLEINGVAYESATAQDLTDWLGLYALCYVSTADDEEKIKYITADNNYEIFELNAYDIVSCNDGVIKYEKSNGKTDTVKISRDADVIKNGQVLSSYNDSDLEINKGSLKLIRRSSSEYDTVIIKSYKDFVVSSIDTDEYIIYNEIHTTEEDWTLELDEDSNTDVIKIKNTDGKALTFSDIKAGNVLSVAKSDVKTEVIVSSAIVDEFKVTGIFFEGERMMLASATESYAISDDYLTFRPDSTISIGMEFKIYINSFGEISYMSASSGGYLYGYLIRTLEGESGEENCYMKVLTPENKVVTFTSADKMKIELADSSAKTYNASAVYGIIKNYRGVISYTKDKQNITKLLIPKNEQSENNVSLYKQYEREEALYKSWAKSFHAEACIDSSSVIFALPEDEDTAVYEDYSAITASELVNSKKYDYTGYCIGENDIYCPVITLTGYTRSVKDTSKYIVVTDIISTVTKDDEIVQEIRGNRAGESITYQAVFDSDGKTKFQKAYSLNGTTDELTSGEGTLSVGEGDIIKCSVNTRTGLVESCQILYDFDMENPDYPGETGYFAQSLGNALTESDKNCNPFTSYNGRYQYGAAITGSGYRYFYGWVYKKVGNYITVTNQNIGAESFVNSDEFYIENYPVNVFTDITNVDYSLIASGNITAKKGASAQIQNYKTVGGDCSRVIVITKSNGDPFQMFILSY